MLQLKAARLHRGDKAATVSLSWDRGAAGSDHAAGVGGAVLDSKSAGILCQTGKRSGLKNAKGCKRNG